MDCCCCGGNDDDYGGLPSDQAGNPPLSPPSHRIQREDDRTDRLRSRTDHQAPIQLSNEATLIWQRGMPADGSSSTAAQILSSETDNPTSSEHHQLQRNVDATLSPQADKDDRRKQQMANIDSVEIEELSTVLSSTQQHLTTRSTIRATDRAETQPRTSFQTISQIEGEERLQTIESVLGDELDAIVMEVDQRVRSGTPSPSLKETTENKGSVTPSPSAKSGTRTTSPSPDSKTQSDRKKGSPISSAPNSSQSKSMSSSLKQAPVQKKSATSPHATRSRPPMLTGEKKGSWPSMVAPISPSKRDSSRTLPPPVVTPSPKSKAMLRASPGRSPKTLEMLRASPNILEAEEGDTLRQTAPGGLSDAPSDLSSEIRDRYSLACRLLKTAMLERESILPPQEKSFLQNLIREEDEYPSEAQLEAVESASQVLLDDSRFDVASVASSSYEHSFDTEREEEQRKLMIASLAKFGGKEYTFRILDADMRTPSVLTPALMEALRGFFPAAVSKENFWLRYCKDRDGGSLATLLFHVRVSRHTLLSVETKDGYVFGAFCSTPWRMNDSWFGSGVSFLWRVKSPRYRKGRKTRDFSHDNEMEIYPFTEHDRKIQYCTRRTMAIGGGVWEHPEASPYPGKPVGIGLTIDGDLMGGETNSCATFANPPLCNRSSQNNEFEVRGLQVWTVTPLHTVVEAERLEMHRLFVERRIGQKDNTVY